MASTVPIAVALVHQVVLVTPTAAVANTATQQEPALCVLTLLQDHVMQREDLAARLRFWSSVPPTPTDVTILILIQLVLLQLVLLQPRIVVLVTPTAVVAITVASLWFVTPAANARAAQTSTQEVSVMQWEAAVRLSL